jgi:hypothetical protein
MRERTGSGGTCSVSKQLLAGIAAQCFFKIHAVLHHAWCRCFDAGCVPIYKGSPNILDIMPEPQAVILYGEGGNASTVQQLDALVADIMADRSRYERMLAWKHKPVSSGNCMSEAYLPCWSICKAGACDGRRLSSLPNSSSYCCSCAIPHAAAATRAALTSDVCRPTS